MILISFPQTRPISSHFLLTSADHIVEKLEQSVDSFSVGLHSLLDFEQRPHVIGAVFHVFLIATTSTAEIKAIRQSNIFRIHHHAAQLSAKRGLTQSLSPDSMSLTLSIHQFIPRSSFNQSIHQSIFCSIQSMNKSINLCINPIHDSLTIFPFINLSINRKSDLAMVNECLEHDVDEIEIETSHFRSSDRQIQHLHQWQLFPAHSCVNLDLIPRYRLMKLITRYEIMAILNIFHGFFLAKIFTAIFILTSLNMV